MTDFFGFSDSMFNTMKINFHTFKNGEHKFRVLPPFAQDKLFEKVDLHWGYTDMNGAKKALKCTQWTHKQCAICNEVEKLKGEIELLKQDVSTPDRKFIAEQIVFKEKRMGDIKRKPTYLWNIQTEDGGMKVLQLSWNGHDALFQKVSFFWKQRKINVTDLNNNYLMFCSRTGQNAKTRYQYEVLEQFVRKIELTSPLIDLSKVYADTTPSQLQEIVDQGCASVPDSDPNDGKVFTAPPPSSAPQANLQANNTLSQQSVNAISPEITPAIQQAVAQGNSQATVAAQLNPTIQATVAQSHEDLMKALQGN